MIPTFRSCDRHPLAEMGPVLLVSPWYRQSIGGVAVVAERLLRTLTKAGVDTYLLVCGEQDSHHSLKPDPTEKNVWYFQIPSYVFYRLTLRTIAAMFFRGPVALVRLFRFVRAHRLRTVVIIYPGEDAWPFLFFRVLGRIRLISSCHGTDVWSYDDYSALHRWCLRRVLECSDAIIVTAAHLAQKIQAILPGRTLPIRMIPNCVNADHFTPLPAGFNRTDTRLTVVHVSNFNPIKRTLDIIEAFAVSAIPPESRLVMVGAGPDLKSAVAHARHLGVGERVEFVGAQRDVRPYLWSADLLVMASEEESGPLVVLEGMACGVPWIASPWGIAAMIPPGECGLVVPARAPHQLAAAIAQLLNDPHRRSAMGARGRCRAEKEVGEAEYIRRHLEVIFPSGESENLNDNMISIAGTAVEKR